MTHPNEQRFRDGYAAFQRRDVEALRNDYFTEDVVWHSPGRNPLSGDFRGIDEVMGAFGRLAQETGGNFSLEIHDCIADDEHAVVIGTVRGERNGKKLEDRYTHVVHMQDGKVAESWLLQEDLYAVDEFFS
ncbi:MAG TPA: nuclear transport factor 2 family protein [Actinomycetota bacterium]